MSKHFEATFDSLRTFECPDWFRDAKLGIWSHWGAQSVPMYGDWYARHMYMEGSPQYLYHVRRYGHPSKFGYKDIINLWKAEKFDPDALMDLYCQAGARYFVGQAMHHDNFFNFPSKMHKWNSVEKGPQKDICGLWKKAADNHKLPFGLSEHLGASFTWLATNKGADKKGPYAGVPYDGNDPAYQDLYLDNQSEYQADGQFKVWYAYNETFRYFWLEVMKELIDLYTPDLLYTDGNLPFGKGWPEKEISHDTASEYRRGLEAVAYLYNKSIEKHGANRAVYTQKNRDEAIYSIGILDIEKSQLPDIRPKPWHTDTCIGNWFYDVRQPFKQPHHIVEILVDIISKNGTMLLNILQLPDGSLDDETRYILKKLAAWTRTCGEGVYATRPWKVSGEGPSSVAIDGFKEEAVAWQETDFRFTQKGNTVYAFIMKTPESRVITIRSFTENEKALRVRLLGGDALPFSQNFGALTVKLPPNMPAEYANCLAVEMG